MHFNSADVAQMAANGTLTAVIMHEMGHVLGIGTLWGTLGLRSGYGYTGAHALAEYRALTGNPGATSVPLETNGGSGTAGAHWSEAVFNAELMTGYIELGGTFMPISRMTIGALEDLGYYGELRRRRPVCAAAHDRRLRRQPRRRQRAVRRDLRQRLGIGLSRKRRRPRAGSASS